MANKNCAACDDLRTNSPNLIVNGLGDTECSSLKNDTGLNPSSGHNDCTDLHNMNDCFIGNMEEEVDAYEVCDWKEFMKNFIQNLWTVLKGIICAICGIWTNIHNLWTKVNCVYNAIKNLVNAINDSTANSKTFVRYYRDNTGNQGNTYLREMTPGTNSTLNIYMDANVDDAGSKNADRDYIVIMHNCTDLRDFKTAEMTVTAYSSADTRNISTIRARQGQHPTLWMEDNTNVDNLSWTTSFAVLVKKGAHIKVDAYVERGAGIDPKYRLHQFAMTWIPVNIETNNDIDISDILKC